ncbi:MAG: 4-hydroxy-3-methylbut-2-enyl diphosphate reductase [Chloroflexota bacterium]|nr:4-hydroxy-3-methylbut-2-enyl diphosphate reductase [Chloroflexota bacterium]MDE2969921.1 4-hydroxy-3-methylbut-2-enyl diphosphate reductase [Chloroflexota bacterium]
MEVILGSPRGFCAGVVRAIDIVELALERFGSPVYVRHEIVHNPFVVEELRGKGAIFVEELEEVPDGQMVIFSAHGVSPEVRHEADRRGLRVLDATCPLVTKVHLEAIKYGGQEYTILLVGHRDHPETIGTSGEAPDRTIVVETVADAETVEVPDPQRVAALTQTTLSVDDTKEIVDALRARFPNMLVRNDICYATTNRQMAAKSLAEDSDVVLVIGASNSSNCNRLREVVEAMGVPAHLVNGPDELPEDAVVGAKRVGIVSGASTPESLVEAVVAKLEPSSIVARDVIDEDVTFVLPRELRD